MTLSWSPEWFRECPAWPQRLRVRRPVLRFRARRPLSFLFPELQAEIALGGFWAGLQQVSAPANSHPPKGFLSRRQSQTARLRSAIRECYLARGTTRKGLGSSC